MIQVIYKITNNINGKTYIGQHKMLSIYKEDGYMGSGKIIKSAIKKYGKENFSKEIITFGIDQFETDILEKFYIENERKLNNNGCYNIASGGGGGSHPQTEEVRIKISKSLKGRTVEGHPNPHNEEWKRKVHESKLGHKVSEETRNKISETKKGKAKSDDFKQKCKERMTGKPNFNKGRHWKLIDGKRFYYD